MTKKNYPTPCLFCEKLLYGPVDFCPYCSGINTIESNEEETGDSKEIENFPEITSEKENVLVSKTEPESFQSKPLEQLTETQADDSKIDSHENNIDEQELAPEVESISIIETVGEASQVNSHSIPVPPQGKWKLVVGGGILIVIILGYLISGPMAPKEVTSQPPAPHSMTQVDSRRESARILARESLSQGTTLSVLISNLPKLGKVLSAAKKLAEISPRYKEQLSSAESTIESARDKRDRAMMAYINKVIELGGYTSEEISYAMKIILNGDLTPREKKVTELLLEDVNDAHASTNIDAGKLLLNFTGSFSHFIN